MSVSRKIMDHLIIVIFMLLSFLKVIGDFSIQSAHSGFWSSDAKGSIVIDAGKAYNTSFSFNGLVKEIHKYAKAIQDEQKIIIKIKQEDVVVEEKNVVVQPDYEYMDIDIPIF